VRRRAKAFKAAVVIAALVGALAIFAANLQGNAIRFYTVDRYLAQRDQLGDGFVQVEGRVVPGSIRYDPLALSLSFEIEKRGATLPVFYHGAKPDVLNDGLDVVAEGRAGSDGVFQAKKLTVKCPSRYNSIQSAGAGQGR